MIAILANNTWLDLSPKASIPFTVDSPLFDRDRLDRSYSFPFTLPATPANLKALKYINRLDSAAKPKHPAEIHLAGQLFESGTLAITNVSGQEMRAVFQSTSINLADTLRAMRLRQLDIPIEVTTPYCPAILIVASYLDPEIDRMALRINEHVFDTAIDELADMIDQINAIFGDIASEPDIGQAPTENVILFTCPGADEFNIYFGVDVATPEVYAFFTLIGSTYDSEAIRIDTAFSALVAAGGDSKLAFPVVKAPNLYDDKNPGYSGYANYTDPSQAHPNDPTLLDVASVGFPHTLIPLPYVSAILPAIASSAGLTAIEGVFFSEKEVSELIAWNNRTIDLVVSPADFIVDDENYSRAHTYTPTFNLSRHFPDISAFEFFEKLSNTFCLVSRLAGSKLEFTACRDILGGPPEDWTAYAEPQFSADINEDQAYTLDYDRQNDETERAGQLERIDGGEDAVEFRPGFYTLFEVPETDQLDNSRSWRVPYITEQGFVPYYDLETTPTLRLLFYRGFHKDSEGNDYAMATHANLNHQGAAVGSYSLAWDGPAGLYEQWWKEYIKLAIDGKEVKRIFRLPAHKLLSLKANPFRRIAIYGAQGAMVGYLKSFRFKASVQGISLTEATIVVA